MQNCALIVMDHYSTSLPIAMAMNTPVVLYWDERKYWFKDAPQKILSLLRKHKILFDNFNDAANHIKSIHGNVDQWWSSEKIQKVRDAFCEELVMVDSNWRVSFTQKINEIIKVQNQAKTRSRISNLGSFQ